MRSTKRSSTEDESSPSSSVGEEVTRQEGGSWEERLRALLAGRWHIVLPVIAYLILVLLGATTSSIGISGLRQEPDAPLGTQIGNATDIRSDEYLTESPLWLGQLAVGASDVPHVTGVSADFFAQLPSGAISSIVFFDGALLTLGPWLPDAMLFAAKWWLPSLLLVIGLPVWFRQVTGRMRWGYLATILIVASPSTVWWSGRPVNTLGFIAAGCALGIWAILKLESGRRALGAIGIVGAGILLARYPSYYQPLAIMIGLPVVLATGGYLLSRPVAWRQRVSGIGLLALSGLLWTGALMFENREAISAGLGTVYPGDRASSSESLSVGRVFGATNLGWLESVGRSVQAGANNSELAQSFTVLLVVAAVMLAARRWTGGKQLAWTTAPVIAVGVFWLIWGTVYLGPLGAALPLINRVPGFRASLGAGFIAIIVFCLVLSQWQETRDRRSAVVGGALAAFLSAWAGSSLQLQYLPALTGTMIWVAAAVTGGVVFALLRWPTRWQPLAATAVVGFLISFSANPLIIGLGDLRASETAQLFLLKGEQARTEGTLWASDSLFVDSLFIATGTPSLTSRQQVGPDREVWAVIDPQGEYEEMWNRGGTFVSIAWSTDSELTFSQPSADVVKITGSPCALAERVPELTSVTSLSPLVGECLTPAGEFRWSGETHHIYNVN